MQGLSPYEGGDGEGEGAEQSEQALSQTKRGVDAKVVATVCVHVYSCGMCAHVYMYIWMYVYMYVCAYVHMDVCVCMYVHMYVCMYVCVCTYGCMCVCTYGCMCVCICVHVHMHM